MADKPARVRVVSEKGVAASGFDDDNTPGGAPSNFAVQQTGGSRCSPAGC